MKFAVWKYHIDPAKIGEYGLFKIKMPAESHVLCVGTQRDYKNTPLRIVPQEKMYFWAKVNPSTKEEERTFCLLATGEVFKAGDKYFASYIDTVHMNESSPLVFHLFAVSER